MIVPLAASPKPARAGAAQDRRVRKIERRLKAQLGRMFPAADIKKLVVELRPLIFEAARDGCEDHDAIWQRARAAPLFQEIADRLAESLARDT